MKRTLIVLFALALAASVLLDFLLLAGKEGTRGFYALFGFAGTAVIVFVSKALGSFFLNRPEDYYERVRRDG